MRDLWFVKILFLDNDMDIVWEFVRNVNFWDFLEIIELEILRLDFRNLFLIIFLFVEVCKNMGMYYLLFLKFIF